MSRHFKNRYGSERLPIIYFRRHLSNHDVIFRISIKMVVFINSTKQWNIKRILGFVLYNIREMATKNINNFSKYHDYDTCRKNGDIKMRLEITSFRLFIYLLNPICRCLLM